MLAQDVMSTPVYSVEAEETLAHARRVMLRQKISRILVMKGGRLAGIITQKDIASRLAHSEPVWRRRSLDQIPVWQFATPDPIVAGRETETDTLIKICLAEGISSIPIIDHEEVVGIVTKTDLCRSARIKCLTAPARRLMEPVTEISRYHTLDHVIDLMTQGEEILVVINANGTLAGSITEAEIAHYELFIKRPGSEERDLTFLRKSDPAGRKQYRYVVKTTVIAEDLMRHPALTLAPDSPLSDVVRLMVENHINSIIMAEKNDINGVVKRDAILKEVGRCQDSSKSET